MLIFKKQLLEQRLQLPQLSSKGFYTHTHTQCKKKKEKKKKEKEEAIFKIYKTFRTVSFYNEIT